MFGRNIKDAFYVYMVCVRNFSSFKKCFLTMQVLTDSASISDALITKVGSSCLKG